MADSKPIPQGGQNPTAGLPAGRSGFDVQRFGMEVAAELGIPEVVSQTQGGAPSGS